MNDLFHSSMQILIIFFSNCTIYLIIILSLEAIFALLQHLSQILLNDPLYIDSNSAVEAIFALLHHLSQNLYQHLFDVLWSLCKHRNLKL